MQSEDRLIHFSTELIHAPRQHERKILQKLYFELSQTRWGYDNTEFPQGAPVRFYSRRGKRSQSTLLILPDRIVLVEEWADCALSDFLERTREIGQRVLSDLGIAAFLAQTATLRSTFALTHFDDAQTFLMEHMCGQADRLGANFKRPIGSSGLRFVLPETPEDRGNLNVRIESFKESRREVFVEVKGLFGTLNIAADSMDIALENIQQCRAFIRDAVYPFMDEYDQTPHDSL